MSARLFTRGRTFKVKPGIMYNAIYYIFTVTEKHGYIFIHWIVNRSVLSLHPRAMFVFSASLFVDFERYLESAYFITHTYYTGDFCCELSPFDACD